MAGSTRRLVRRKKQAGEFKELYVVYSQFCHRADGRAPVDEMGLVGRRWNTKNAEVVK